MPHLREFDREAAERIEQRTAAVVTPVTKDKDELGHGSNPRGGGGGADKVRQADAAVRADHEKARGDFTGQSKTAANATSRAERATDRAEKSGSPADHAAAAKAHDDASRDHAEAVRSTDNEDHEAIHAGMDTYHSEMAKYHTSKS